MYNALRLYFRREFSDRHLFWLKNQTEQMDNYFVAFIKLYLTYIFFCYLRASDERPYGVAIILLYSENSYKRKRSALRTPFSYAHKIIKKEGNSLFNKVTV